jgi:dihydrofolate reductase
MSTRRPTTEGQTYRRLRSARVISCHAARAHVGTSSSLPATICGEGAFDDEFLGLASSLLLRKITRNRRTGGVRLDNPDTHLHGGSPKRGPFMSRSVLYMSMSVDGYIAGPNDKPHNPGGDDFMRLHEWYGFTSEPGPDAASSHPSGFGKHFLDEIKETGAVLAGRNTVEQVDHWGGDHHDGVPIFVPSHRAPGPSAQNYPLVSYVTDGIASAMEQAKAAAGDRNVLVHGAYTARTAIEAGVLDELQIHQVSVLFGTGRRLFEVLSARVELTITQVINTPQATHIRYRIGA